MEEIWKDISGFEGYYQVSNLGRVKSIDRRVKSGKGNGRISYGRIKQPSINNKGYFMHKLNRNCKQYNFLLHRLVAQAFIPNPNNYPEIDHMDGNPQNNNLENLRWVTHKENSNTEIRKKRLSDSHKKEKHVRWGKFGKDNPCSKSIACYKNNVLIKKYDSYTQAEKEGFSRKGIYRNVNNITSSYKGYIWKELK